jgi:hypothetical protein
VALPATSVALPHCLFCVAEEPRVWRGSLGSRGAGRGEGEGEGKGEGKGDGKDLGVFGKELELHDDRHNKLREPGTISRRAGIQHERVDGVFESRVLVGARRQHVFVHFQIRCEVEGGLPGLGGGGDEIVSRQGVDEVRAQGNVDVCLPLQPNERLAHLFTQSDRQTDRKYTNRVGEGDS